MPWRGNSVSGGSCSTSPSVQGAQRSCQVSEFCVRMSSRTHILGCQNKVIQNATGASSFYHYHFCLYLREPSRDLERSKVTVAFLVFKILSYWGPKIFQNLKQMHALHPLPGSKILARVLKELSSLSHPCCCMLYIDRTRALKGRAVLLGMMYASNASIWKWRQKG